MAFATDESVWDEFLEAWPLERLRSMTLEEYTQSGNKNTFTYWIEARLDQYGSIWGGSAFKFAIYSRSDKESKQGDTALAYTDDYAWYRRFGDTPQAAFEAIRAQVVAVAEAARAGRLAAIDDSALGRAYRWKIAFHYQDRSHPTITCVFLRKPLRSFLGLPHEAKSTPMYQLQQQAMARKPADERVTAFGADVWRQWVTSHPLQIELTEGAIKNGYLNFNLLKAPFLETMYGDLSGNAPGETARFRTDRGETFDTDIRAAGSSGRLRHRFGSYFANVGAVAGDVVEISPDEDGGYVIVHIPKGKTQVSKPSAAPPANDVRESATEYVMNPVNRILFGPPGTGKTFRTVNEALAILDPVFLDEHAGKRTELKVRFDELVDARRIRFVTFHQSFSYEDFVEGIRADSEGGQLQYRIEPGVFRSLCEDAGGSAQVAEDVGVRDGARIWKISIDGTTTLSPTREYCFKHGEARIGWPAVGDLRAERLAETPEFTDLGSNDRSTLHAFSREIEPGDVLLCIGSETTVQAIGVVQGEYDYQPRTPSGARDDYPNTLPVKWLATGLSLDIRPINDGRQFTLKTVYEITRFGWPELSEYLDSETVVLAGATTSSRTPKMPYVLIIDEINRGNISRIFGELITLIEPSKRKGAPEALEVVLPYSKKRFSVPSNVHLIGTMNTADRSLAGLDVALRRRFEFLEVMPDPSTLRGVVVAGVPLDDLLTAMNQRIEVLMGRDYMLGHAYFLCLKDDPTIEALAAVFHDKVLPLLREYFYADWQKIAWVLNDHRKPETLRFIQQVDAGAKVLFGDDVDLPNKAQLWQVNAEAFEDPAAYRAVIAVQQASA